MAKNTIFKKRATVYPEDMEQRSQEVAERGKSRSSLGRPLYSNISLPYERYSRYRNRNPFQESWIPPPGNFYPSNRIAAMTNFPSYIPEREETLRSGTFIKQHLRDLAHAFTDRTGEVKKRIMLPPTPSSDEESDKRSGSKSTTVGMTVAKAETRHRIITLHVNGETMQDPHFFDTWTTRFRSFLVRTKERYFNFNNGLDPQGYFYILWLFIVTIAYHYNCWTIPLRSVFPYQTPKNTPYWLLFDYIGDFIYVLDILVFQPRVIYVDEGFWIDDFKLTRSHYRKSFQFKLDLLSLLPLDFFYFLLGTEMTILRAPRLLKFHAFMQSFKLLDRIVPSPHAIRVFRTLIYMFYIIHINACLYYAFSDMEGINTNTWTYDGSGTAYTVCFYMAFKTATGIGKNAKPGNNFEFIYMTIAWLMGVFVFAVLIGQIRDIIATATRSQSEYRNLVDETLRYLRHLKMPEETQEKVKMWFSYTWKTQRTLDENGILNYLPYKMKIDISMSMHMKTLSKISLFTEISGDKEALLRELVLKLRSVIYLPGDLICRRGEVGTEMYIIRTGSVQVVGQRPGDVLATLHQGSVFGEISLIAVDGANRRTADVVSMGYSNLFVLSKSDLNEAIVYYPEAQAALRKKANELMRKNAQREKTSIEDNPVILIKNPRTPSGSTRLIDTLLQLLPKDSGTQKLLLQGSKSRIKRRRGRIPERRRERYKKVNPGMEDEEDLSVDVAGPSHTVQPSRNTSVSMRETSFVSRTPVNTFSAAAENPKPDSSFECDVTVHRKM